MPVDRTRTAISTVLVVAVVLLLGGLSRSEVAGAEVGTAANDDKPQSSARGVDRGRSSPTHFQFTKTGSLIRRPAGMPKPGPYYPSLVSMKEVDRFPHDYALYFSTDHDHGPGGTWLYVCSGSPTVAANWKSYDRAVADGEFDYLDEKPDRNPIFVDTIQGRQTETPWANVIRRTVYMTYHNCGAGHSQSTLPRARVQSPGCHSLSRRPRGLGGGK